MPNENELKERLEEVRRKLMVMEWDQSHNQLNAGKMGMFNELREEKLKIETELSQSAEKDGIQPEAGANSEIKRIE